MLIVGCGDVGTLIAEAARARGESVACITRTADSAAALQLRGHDARALDLDRARPGVTDFTAHRRIFYLAPPPPTGDDDPRIERFLDAVPAQSGRRIVYVSTTGVYGDCDGDWVDESRPPNPQVDRSRRRLDAEQQLHEWRHTGGGELVICDRAEDRAFKLGQGEAIVYPATSLHRVEPVTTGSRLVVVGWFNSWVRDPAQREILFDLWQAVAAAEAAGDAAQLRLLSKSRTNLLRMWAG